MSNVEEGDSSEDEGGVGAQAPPLTAEIAGILRRYPDGGQILKELIQNADDAGATEVRFLLDSREHNSVEALFNNFSRFQGPALYAWNNALFKKNDWKALAKINQSSKTEDVLKVGRFGLGFLSVFHLTDLPLVVSGKYMAFIDPHRTTVKTPDTSPAGVKKRLRVAFKCSGHAATFDGIFDCDRHSEEYNGTLFRFPLRQHGSQSKISQNVNTTEDIKSTHFESLKCEASFLLLFLNNVKKVSLYDMRASALEPELLFSVNVNSGSENKFCLPKEKVNQVVHLSSNSVSTCDSESGQSLEHHWLILNVVGSANEEINKFSQELCTLPWIGLAAEMPVPIRVSCKCHDHPLGHAIADLVSKCVELSWNQFLPVSGQAFCFLPLPISTSLPIHLHGYFSVSDNRRGIKWPGHDEKSHEALWNRALIREMIAPAYATLLSSACKLTSFPPTTSTPHTKNELSPAYSLWPCFSEIKNHPMCLELLQPMLSCMKDAKVLWTTACGGRWVSFQEAYFVPDGCSGVVVTTLLEAGVPVVLLPDNVRVTVSQESSLREVLASRAITPAILRKHFPTDVKFVVSEELYNLLEYALSDINGSNFKEIHGVPLLPLQNGSCCKFRSRSSSSCVYLLPDSLKSYYPDILPGINHLIVDTSLPPALEKLVREVASNSYTQVKAANLSDICSLFKFSISTWLSKDFKWCPGEGGHPPRHWLEKVWKWIGGSKEKLSSLTGLPLVPQKRSDDSKYFLLLPVDSNTCFCYFYSSNPEVYSMFKALKVHVVEDTITDRLLFHKLSISLVLDMIANHKLQAVIDHMDKDYKGLLRWFFCSFFQRQKLNDCYKNCLKSLPIFSVISSAGSSCVALNDQCQPFLPPVARVWPQTLVTPKGMLCNQDQQAVELIQYLGTKPIRFFDFCNQRLIPLVQGLISDVNASREGDHIVLWMLRQMAPRDKETKNIISRLSQMEFVKTRSGRYCRARDLFNGEDEEFAILLNNVSAVTPDEQYQPYFHWLKEMGLKSWTDVKSKREDLIKLISESIRSIGDTGSEDSVFQRGQFILNEVFGNKILTNDDRQIFSKCKFLGALKRPTNYPLALKWHTTNSTDMFSLEKLHICDLKMPSLVGAVQPIISDKYQVRREARNFFKCLTESDLQSQLHHIEVLQFDAVNVQVISGIVQCIYKVLSELTPREKLKTIWCPFLSPPSFVSSDNFVLEFPFTLEPFVYKLPSSYQPFKILWDIETTIGVTRALKVLSELKQLCDVEKRILSKREIKMSSDLVRWLYEKRPSRNINILFPTLDSQLKSSQDCVYDDRGWVRNTSSPAFQGNWSYVDSDRIAPAVAKYFHVQPLSIAIAPSSTLAIEYTMSGQYETITNRIARIVEDYSNDIDIFKELIQNADDAKATEIKFLIDWRSHPDSSLLCEQLNPWQGPALLAYNNSVFSADDLKNICKVAGETKLTDPMKTGRFGLGFCATYQVTDLPSFVTGKFVVIFDPHTDYLGERITSSKPGMQIDLVKTQANLKIYKHQFLPYDGLFGCQIFELPEDGYNGTLFRFPFRNDVTSRNSKISRKIYGPKEVHSLVQSLKANCHDLILFQKFISEISVYEWKKGSSTMTKLFSVTKESKETAKRIRLLEKAKCADNILEQCSSSCIIRSPHNVKSPQSSSWIVCSVLNLQHQNEELLKCSTQTGVLPFGEIALQVTGEGVSLRPKSVNGNIFCFLPLPICNGLHFHVNGHFHVSRDRRSLSLADDDSFGTKWNMFLSEHVHNYAFVNILKAFILDVDLTAYEEEEKTKFLESYYQLWHFSITKPNSIAPRVIDGIKQLLQSADSKLLWSEYQGGKWLSVEEAILFVNNVWDEVVMNDIRLVFLKLNYKFVEIPKHVVELIREKVGSLGHAYDYQRFISEVLFPQVSSSKFMPEWIHSLKYILKKIPAYPTERNKFAWAEQLLKSKPCIPCQQSSTLKNIDDLIDCTQEKLAQIYDVAEGIFPIKELLASPLKAALIRLGMSSFKLTSEQLINRAKSVSQISSLEHALQRSTNFIQYLKATYTSSPPSCKDLKLISKIPFLLVCKKPDQIELPWLGESSNFCSPAEVYEERDSALVFTVSKIIPDKEGGLPFEVLKNPSPLLVVQHLENLVKSTQKTVKLNEATIAYMNKVMRKVYSYLDSTIRNWLYSGKKEANQVVQSVRSILTPFWQDGIFQPVAKVVWESSVSCPPYITVVSESYHKFETFFLKVLKVEKELTPAMIVNALSQINQDFSSGRIALPKKILDFVIQLSSKIAEQNLSIDCNSIYLPDDKCMLRPVHQLACDNFQGEWIKSSSSYQEHFQSGAGYFTHPDIPRVRAIKLGVRPLLDAVIEEMEDDSFVSGCDFKQYENLCVRLNGILKKYPADASILQEFIQNADDAQATEVVFILDHCTKHPDKTLLCQNNEWVSLQHTPALCIVNNRPFTEEDIKGISDLGRGAKRESSQKIGKFGIGFNVAYHVTDCPSFLSCGKGGIPENLCVLDPTWSFVQKRKGGRRWKLNSNHISDFEDQFHPYLLQDILKGSSTVLTSPKESGFTIFRLPLTRALSKRRDLCNGAEFTPELVLERLFNIFKDSSKELLLFLSNVRSISAIEIKQDGQYCHCFTTTCTVPSIYVDECLHFQQHTALHIDQLKQKKLSKSQPLSLFFKLDIDQKIGSSSDCSSDSWLVQKVTFGNFQLCELQVAIEHSLRAVGGVAALLKPSKCKEHKLFCFLPTPVETRLPVHVNGHFAVDDSRKHLESEHIFGKACDDWNIMLVKNVIVPAYIELIRNAKEYYISQPCENIQVDECLYHLFPKVWPKSASLSLSLRENIILNSSSLHQFLPTSFYCQLSKQDQLLLIRKKPSIWISFKKAVFYLSEFERDRTTIINVPDELFEVLLKLGLNIVKDCSHIYSGLCEAGFLCSYLNQELVISCLRSVDLQNENVKSVVKDNLELMIEFCIQGRRRKNVASCVPMLLYADGSLRRSAQTFPYRFSTLLPKCLSSIVDQKLGSSQVGHRLEECHVISPPSLEFIAQNIDILYSVGPVKATPEHTKLVSLLWPHILYNVDSNQLQDKFRWKPILPAADGWMYPMCLAKSIIGNPDKPVNDLLLKLGYRRICLEAIKLNKEDRMKFVVETVTFSKSADFCPCFMLGKPPKFDTDLDEEEVKLLLRSLCAYKAEDLKAISIVASKLKIYRHAGGTKFVSLHGSSRVCIVPPPLPKEGLDLVQSKVPGVTFLMKPDTSTEILYQNVITRYPDALMDTTRVYLDYIIPNFPAMNEKQIFVHVDFIQGNPSLLTSKSIMNKLMKTPFVACNGKLCCVDQLYDPRVEFFCCFKSENLPNREWHSRLTFLARLGLHTHVCRDEWLDQAKKFASSHSSPVKFKQDQSVILLDELNKIIKGNLSSDKEMQHFLAKMCELPFICCPDNLLYGFQLKKFISPPKDLELFAPFCGSVANMDAALAFNLCSVLPEKCDEFIRNPKVRSALRVQVPIPTKLVLEHFKYVCDASSSYFSLPVPDRPVLDKPVPDSTVSEKSAPDRPDNSLKHLLEVIDKHLAYLNKTTLKPEEIAFLKEIACIPVDAMGSRKMVKVSQVIELLPTSCNLEPFIYKLPPQVAQYTRLMEALGVRKELTADDCRRVLDDLSKLKVLLSQDAESLKVAECAYHELIRCLRHQKSENYSGVLLSDKYELLLVGNLLYNDVPWFRGRVQSCKFSFIVQPNADAQGSRKPPKALNVRLLSEVVKEQVHERCTSRDALCNEDVLHSQEKREERCFYAARVATTLSSPQFYEGMLRIYFADYNGNPPKSFLERVRTLQSFEIVCLQLKLSTVLAYNNQIIPGSEDSRQSCCLSSDKKVFFIYPHNLDFKQDKFLKDLSSQLNLALGSAIKNEQNIGLLFECEPEFINFVLTEHRVREYSSKLQITSESFCKVGSSPSMSSISNQDGLIMVNFKIHEKVIYYTPKGQLLYAEVVKSHSGLEGRSITSCCVKIATKKLDDEDIELHSILVSPLELFKIFTSAQKRCLQENKPQPSASPLVLAAVPCKNVAKMKTWCRGVYQSDDVQKFSGLLMSLVKIRLTAHLHYHFITGRMTREVFKAGVFEILHLASSEQLPFTPISLAPDLVEEMDTVTLQMSQLSITEGTSDDDDEDTDVQCETEEPGDHQTKDTDVQCETKEPRDHQTKDQSNIQSVGKKSSDHLRQRSNAKGANTREQRGQTTERKDHQKQEHESGLQTVSKEQDQVRHTDIDESPKRRNSMQWKRGYERYQLDSGDSKPSSVSKSPSTVAGSSHQAKSSTGHHASHTVQATPQIGSRFSKPKSTSHQIPRQQSRFKSTDKDECRKPPLCKEKAIAWFEQAKVDYKAAEELLRIGESAKTSNVTRFPALVCFLCHDIMEKCLKALFYVYEGDFPPYRLSCTNLVTLMNPFKAKEDHLKKLYDTCKDTVMVLSVYENKSRYPNFHNPPCAPAAVYVHEDAVEAFSAISTFMKILKADSLLCTLIGELTIMPKPKFISSLKSASNDSVYPDSWDEMKDDEEVKLFLLDSETEVEEYSRVQGEFSLTLPHCTVIKVFRIQNKPLWDVYSKCSQTMMKRNDGILKEQLLFHGTRTNNPELIFKGTSGFDMRHSNNGMWGRGNYFATNASYSNSYAYCESGIKKMFAAWVLTGISHESAPHSFVKPPVRNVSSENQVEQLYDCVTGVTGGTRVYITYDNEHAYPAYLIVYQ